MLKKLIYALTPESVKLARAEARAWQVLADVIVERRQMQEQR